MKKDRKQRGGEVGKILISKERGGRGKREGQERGKKEGKGKGRKENEPGTRGDFNGIVNEGALNELGSDGKGVSNQKLNKTE